MSVADLTLCSPTLRQRFLRELSKSVMLVRRNRWQEGGRALKRELNESDREFLPQRRNAIGGERREAS